MTAPYVLLDVLVDRVIRKFGPITIEPHSNGRFHAEWGDGKYSTSLSSPSIEDLFRRLDTVEPEIDAPLPLPSDFR